METKRCAKGGCPRKVKGTKYCAEHSKERQDDSYRPTASQRGYDHKWTKYRNSYLKRNPLCVMCKANNKITMATVVDHIKPAIDGHNDPRFFDPSNHQALCRQCHSVKTRTQDKRGFGAVGGSSRTMPKNTRPAGYSNFHGF